jgi:hypothetical protein
MQSFSLSKRNPRGKQGTARHMQALAFLKKQRERGGEGYLVQWRAGQQVERSWAPV